MFEIFVFFFQSEENDASMLSHVITLASEYNQWCCCLITIMHTLLSFLGAMPEPYKSQENLKKLQGMLDEVRTRELFKIAVDVNAGCPNVFKAVVSTCLLLYSQHYYQSKFFTNRTFAGKGPMV